MPQFTFFVGAGPGAGIQVLQRVLAKLNQLGRSHVLKYTLKSSVTHILQENTQLLPQTEIGAHAVQQMLAEGYSQVVL